MFLSKLIILFSVFIPIIFNNGSTTLPFNIKGKLVDQNNIPIADMPMGIGEVYCNNPCTNYFWIFDTSWSPRAITNSNGEFLFTDNYYDPFVLVLAPGDINYIYVVTNKDGEVILWDSKGTKEIDIGVIIHGIQTQKW